MLKRFREKWRSWEDAVLGIDDPQGDYLATLEKRLAQLETEVAGLSAQSRREVVVEEGCDQTYTEKLGHYADINKTFSQVRDEEYDAVYAAGGRGPEYIRTDKRIQAMVRHFHETGKPIFTICHGVQILMAVPGVLKGGKVAGLGACEPEVTAVGGTFIDVKPTEAYIDGNMVSAKGWTGLAAFIRECLKVLGTKIMHS